MEPLATFSIGSTFPSNDILIVIPSPLSGASILTIGA